MHRFKITNDTDRDICSDRAVSVLSQISCLALEQTGFGGCYATDCVSLVDVVRPIRVRFTYRYLTSDLSIENNCIIFHLYIKYMQSI